MTKQDPKTLVAAATSILIAVLLISLSSQLAIDLQIGDLAIPVTGQTLAVLLVACTLPWRSAVTAVVVYLVLGVAGLPVFAEGASGTPVITGNSGGYLIGFLVASTLIATSNDRLSSYSAHLQAHVFGTLIILICGYARLSYLTRHGIAWEYGIVPFLPGAVIKILLGSVMSFYFRSYLRKVLHLQPNS